MTYNILIIGAGIVGAAAARELSKYRLNILVLDQAEDAACGATKANSGILHAGYDCVPGTVKAALNLRGAKMYRQLAADLQIPCRNNGSMVVARGREQHAELQALYGRGVKNGVQGIKIIKGAEARKLEPNLREDITEALVAESACVISPYGAAIAFMENAVANGVKFLFNARVTGITPTQNGFEIYAEGNGRGEVFSAQSVVNAAGVSAAEIQNFISKKIYPETILTQRGQYYLLDNTSRGLVEHTIFQLPTEKGKGVLVAPTVDYNILVGPSAEDGETSVNTTPDGLQSVLETAALSLTQIPIRNRITAFAGVRAKHPSGDFVINQPMPGFFNALGIDSPGLTAAPAIAERLAEMACAFLNPKPNVNFIGTREAIKQNLPSGGQVVCRCETVTEAEIAEAIRRGATSLDGVKRRTRAQMGRCQGGFCTTKIMEILSRELGVPAEQITKNGAGSELLC